MNQGSGEGGLGWWAGPGQDLGIAYDTVSRSPNFAPAVQALASGMLDLAARNRDLLEIFKDAGRYSVAMWAFYLNETGGLTLAGLREVCERAGLQSPGRVRALLQFLEHLGYVERRGGMGRSASYALTDAFVEAWDAQLRTALAAAAALEPQVGDFLVGADATAIRAFGRIHADGFLGVVDLSAVPRVVRVFLHAYAGSEVLYTLLCSSPEGAFPPLRGGPVSLASLANRFQVSRIQVKRVLAAAEREGLARVDGDGFVHFTEEAREELRFFYCVQFVQILRAAGRTAALCGFAPVRSVA